MFQESLIKNIKAYFELESFAKLLIFLLPIGAALIPHWESSMFSLLFFSSIYFLFSRRKINTSNLQKDEKIILWLMVLYFCVFILTTLINTEWGHDQNKFLGVEIRFLCFVPIYLMLRNVDNLTTILLKGVVISGVLLGCAALYEVYILEQAKADGGYFILYFGSVSTLFLTLILFSDFLKSESAGWRRAAYCSSVLLIIAIVLSTARMAFLAVIVSMFLWLLFFYRGKKLYIGLTVASLFMIVAYMSSYNIKSEVDKGLSNSFNYFSVNEVLAKQSIRTNMGSRFEMWKVSLLIIQENPVLGVGRGRYNSAAQHHVDKGQVSSVVLGYSHPHNAYIETTVSRGFIGLLIFLMVFYYPVIIFIKAFSSRSHASLIGIGLIVCLSVFSMTETMMFLRGKFLSIYLVALACILSSCFMKKPDRKHT